MTIQELMDGCELELLTVCDEKQKTRTIEGCYIGDFLSWAMGKVREGNLWLTVMGNVNAIAVAVLADAACIVLVDNAVLDDQAKLKAIEQNVVVFSTTMSAFDLAVRFSEML